MCLHCIVIVILYYPLKEIFLCKDFQSVPESVLWKVSAIERFYCIMPETKEIIYKSVNLKEVVYNCETHGVNGP